MPEVFILSIFSRRSGATNGPFFNDLAINQKLLFAPVLHDEAVARLVFRAGLESLRQLTPRTHRMMAAATTLRFALSAAHWVIDRVHDHAAPGRAPALPASASGLAARHVHVIDVADLTDRSKTRFVDSANFARRKFDQRVTGFPVAQRGLLPGAAGDLAAAAWGDFNVMNARSQRDNAERQRIPEIGRRLVPRHHFCADRQSIRGEDVAHLPRSEDHTAELPPR